MNYTYGNVADLKPKHLTALGITLAEVRTNYDNTKFVLRVPQDKLRYFPEFTFRNLADVRSYLASSAWTGQSWFSNLFGGGT